MNIDYRLLTYLASPYTLKGSLNVSEGLRVQEERFKLVTLAAAALIEHRGWNVFSPITHSHPLHVLAGLKGDWEFWKRIDTEYITLSARLVVLCLPGWSESTGVQAEIKIAKEQGIPVLYMSRPVLEPFPLNCEGHQITYRMSENYDEV